MQKLSAGTVYSVGTSVCTGWPLTCASAVFRAYVLRNTKHPTSSACELQCQHLVSALNMWEAWTAGSTATQFPGHECTNNLTSERRLDLQTTCTWVIDVLDLVLTCYQWMLLQPGTGGRPFNGCRNWMYVLYFSGWWMCDWSGSTVPIFNSYTKCIGKPGNTPVQAQLSPSLLGMNATACHWRHSWT